MSSAQSSLNSLGSFDLSQLIIPVNTRSRLDSLGSEASYFSYFMPCFCSCLEGFKRWDDSGSEHEVSYDPSFQGLDELPAEDLGLSLSINVQDSTASTAPKKTNIVADKEFGIFIAKLDTEQGPWVVIRSKDKWVKKQVIRGDITTHTSVRVAHIFNLSAMSIKELIEENAALAWPELLRLIRIYADSKSDTIGWACLLFLLCRPGIDKSRLCSYNNAQAQDDNPLKELFSQKQCIRFPISEDVHAIIVECANILNINLPDFFAHLEPGPAPFLYIFYGSWCKDSINSCEGSHKNDLLSTLARTHCSQLYASRHLFGGEFTKCFDKLYAHEEPSKQPPFDCMVSDLAKVFMFFASVSEVFKSLCFPEGWIEVNELIVLYEMSSICNKILTDNDCEASGLGEFGLYSVDDGESPTHNSMRFFCVCYKDAGNELLVSTQGEGAERAQDIKRHLQYDARVLTKELCKSYKYNFLVNSSESSGSDCSVSSDSNSLSFI